MLEPGLVRLLEESGRSWSVDDGKKHSRLLVEGRVVLVVPRSRKKEFGGGRQVLNARATLKRYLKITERPR